MAKPKGSQKTGGRQKGTPNILTASIKQLASSHGPAALTKVAELMNSPDERVALAASQEMMNRAYGKAPQSIEGTEDGPPIKQVLEVLWAGQNTSK